MKTPIRRKVESDLQDVCELVDKSVDKVQKNCEQIRKVRNENRKRD